MLKLPLIFLQEDLYAGAITQFYWLSVVLETRLEKHKEHPMVASVRSLGLCVSPGYEADLAQLFGDNWRKAAVATRTPATDKYVEILEAADPISLVAAAFILYGALVVGGGKLTQAKVRKVIPRCNHLLFDVADDMSAQPGLHRSRVCTLLSAWLHVHRYHRYHRGSHRFCALRVFRGDATGV